MITIGLSIITLISSTSALCNYFFDAGDTYQLEVCSWSREGWSYAYYCRENWNNTGRLYVVEYQYDGPDCLDVTSAIIYNEWDCENEGYDCNCGGDPADCVTATRIKSDINEAGCNETTTRTSSLVWDICIDRHDLGGMFVDCDDTLGVKNTFYENTDCTGARIETPSPSTDTYMGCTEYQCTPGSNSGGKTNDDGNGGGAGIAIAVVVIILVLCLCGVGIFCFIRSKNKDKTEVYFDNNVGTI